MRTTDVDAVEAANAEFYAAFEETDYDRMGAVWADGDDAGTLSCVHPGWAMIHGRSRVMRSWAVIFANTPYIQFVLTDVSTVVAGDVAVVTCTENILTAVDDSESGAPGPLGGGRVVATNVFHRRPEGWRLLVHHGSPVIDSVLGDDEDDEDGHGHDGHDGAP